MSVLKTCCCGCSVRTGTILSAIYTFILSILNCCLAVFGLVSLKVLYESTEENSHLLNYHVLVTSGWLYAIISLSSVLTVASLVMVIGVIKNIKWLLVPWMVVVISTMVLDVAVLIYDCAVFGMLSFNLVQMFLWLVSTLVNVYCLLCVYSHFRNISSGRHLDNSLQSQGLIVYSTTIQRVHFTQGPLYIQCADPSTTVITSLLNNNTQGAGLTQGSQATEKGNDVPNVGEKAGLHEEPAD